MSEKAGEPVPECQIDVQLHCFPDITANVSSGGRQCKALEDSFQRAYYPKGKADRGGISTGSGAKMTRSVVRHLSPAQAEERAYGKGFADGKQQGLKEGDEAAIAKIEPLMGALQQAIEQMQVIRKQTHQDIESEVVELALAIARKVICREIATGKQSVVAVAREALRQVEHPGKIKIKMNPDDLQAANEAGYEFSSLTENMKAVSVETETGISAGGCVIETDCGEIDARIDKQLQAVEAAFHNEMKRSGSQS